jgi:hypothetical protein
MSRRMQAASGPQDVQDKAGGECARQQQGSRIMTLEIVWRNPIPTHRTTNSIQRVAQEERLAVYVVLNAEGTGRFEVLFGGAA